MNDTIPQSRIPRWVWMLAWLGCWAFLFVLTHIPKVPVSAPQGSDKVAHMVSYFVLVMLGGIAAHSRGVRISGRWLGIWFLIYAAYGALDEYLQSFVGRSCELHDWLADMIGVTAATAILWMQFGGKREAEEDSETLHPHQ